MPLLAPAKQVPVEQSGQGWMPGMVPDPSVAVSPVRKRIELSGRAMLVAPVLQLTVPEGAVASVLTTQTLIGVVIGFGTASGAPKKHPGLLQFFRLPPVWVDVVAPTVAVWPEQDVIEVTLDPRSGSL
jgi:hypothetical protein